VRKGALAELGIVQYYVVTVARWHCMTISWKSAVGRK